MSTTYGAGTVKRVRRTKAELEEFRSQIYRLAEENRPCSCRQVYYLGIGTLWDKDSGGSRRNYNKVVHELGVMREAGDLPWGWITDATRYRRIPTMYNSWEEAAQRTAEHYRRDLWAMQPRHVEVWAESDSISGVIDPVTRQLGVGLFSCRGQASKTFVWSTTQEYQSIGKPVSILYVGDWDPSGLAISRSLHERLREYSERWPIAFSRVALTAADVGRGDLTSHPINPQDKNLRRYTEECRAVGLSPDAATEVEALPPPVLRTRLEERLYDLIEDPTQWNATLAAEQSERQSLLARLTGGHQ
jgi:hypothetical protein